MADDELRTIKIRSSAYDRLQALLARLASHGWRSVGVDREDPPTIADVVDEGLQLLEARGASRSAARRGPRR
jgi:hypothetical protein